jgi:uncharacterized heparinase superfamily protein
VINEMRLLAVSSWHTRPAQLRSRLQLIVRRHLEVCRASVVGQPGVPYRPPQPMSENPPRSLFPPGAGHDVIRTDRDTRVRLANRTWPLAVPQEWNPPELGDRLETLLLHSMEYAEALDNDMFQAVVEDWIDQNPPYGPGYWLRSWNGYALSIRVVVWMQQLAARARWLRPEFTKIARLSIEQQLDFLTSHLEVDIGGNHLVRNIRALLWAGRFFDGAAAARWRDIGSTLLERELAAQVLTDGCHFEVSPAYHLQVFADLLDCAALLPAGPLRDRLDETLHAMAQVAADMTHPDGFVSLFNDGWLHMTYSPAACLDVYARLFAREVTPRRTFALREAGYFGVRRARDLVIVDAGRIGPDHLPAHAHGDIFSFEWTLAGQRVIVDAGVSEYAPGEWRDYARSTRAHNTVTVGDEDQCEFWSSFRVARRARVTRHHYGETAGGFVLEASHDGYRRLTGAPVHTRRFDVTPHRIEVRDQVQGGAGQPVRARLLLHPAVRVEPVEGGLTLTIGHVQAALRARHEISLEQAWWSPEFNTRHETVQVVLQYGAAPCDGGFLLEVRE